MAKGRFTPTHIDGHSQSSQGTFGFQKWNETLRIDQETGHLDGRIVELLQPLQL